MNETIATLDASELKALCLQCGADDAGFVELERLALASEQSHVQEAMVGARCLVSLVCRMNQEPIRSPARSVSNLEFHHAGDAVNEAGRRLVAALQERHVRAVNCTMGFPMEMDRWPERAWVVAHKPIAVEAGLGRVGIHRNVIHPRFGSFILLGTIILDRPVSAYGHPLPDNPCLECKLCVAACPTGAIKADGAFDFGACYTHNYREFMGGFGDWVETIADSSNRMQYRQAVEDRETVSMWQSLSFGPNYKAAYCISVCPAGEDVLGPFRASRKGFLEQVVDPLQRKVEPVYVVAGSDAEAHVKKRFPHKQPRRVRNGLRPVHIRQFVRMLPLLFQRGAAGDLSARFHFDFTGSQASQVTAVIQHQTIEVQSGLQGRADVSVKTAGSDWVRFVRGEVSMLHLLLSGRLRLKGSPRLLRAFGRCFPS